MCLCLKYLVLPSKKRAELGVLEVVSFPVPGEIVYSFFNFFFDIFWNSISLTQILHFGKENLVYDYFFTSQRESDFFAIPSHIFFPLELLRIKNRVTKIKFRHFNGNYDYSSYPCWSTLFLYAPSHKSLVFWKSYLWARLLLS